jgi:hypothetical protein
MTNGHVHQYSKEEPVHEGPLPTACRGDVGTIHSFKILDTYAFERPHSDSSLLAGVHLMFRQALADWHQNAARVLQSLMLGNPSAHLDYTCTIISPKSLPNHQAPACVRNHTRS